MLESASSYQLIIYMLAKKLYVSICHYVYLQAYNDKVVISFTFIQGKFVFKTSNYVEKCI